MLSEAHTRAKLIDPAIHTCGWTEDLIKREETAGAIEVLDGKPRRRPRGRVDYTLRVKVNLDTQPVAVALIEAKASHLPPAHGLEQAKLYAACKRLNVPFVFSTNGHLFVEFDRTTGLTAAARPLAEFPSPADLRLRYEQAAGFKLEEPAARPLLTRYHGGEATRRYYQDAAIRAVFEKLARCEHTGEPKRALLALATGAGKTFIAVNLLKRIADAGQLGRALFVCDRDELRNQGLAAFQNVFGNDAAEVSAGSPQKNARVVIATYQTLDVDSDEASANFLTANYPENYFTHIIIDECHRSAWGKWSQVLTRNAKAVQVGLTATPRKLKITEKTQEALADEKIIADNSAYFGDPVYEYDMSQGMEDGYLAACEIRKSTVNIDETGITLEEILARNPKNSITGEPVTLEELQELYEKTQYEDRIMLPDRVLAMCQDLFQHLLVTGGPEQKTIIFCVRDTHSDAVAAQMNNLYAEWCRQESAKLLQPYAFKCTASVGGSQFVADLRGASRSYFMATTVDLLSTGVDVPCVRNIVFFKYVRSPISFYQMVGRGTRLDPATGKLMFRVYDYTNATRLFGEDFITEPPTSGSGGGGVGPPPIEVEGFEVLVTDAGRMVVTQVDGRAMPVSVEEYKQIIAARLIEEAPTLDDFRRRWIAPPQRHDLLTHLPEAGASALLIRTLDDMGEYDLYDVLAELGYGTEPRTRQERADAVSYKHREWLAGLPERTREALAALTAQFADSGTDSLENPQIFSTPQLAGVGGLQALAAIGKPSEVLQQTKERIFAP
jgi:type I restriction enzyme, R subunit